MGAGTFFDYTRKKEKRFNAEGAEKREERKPKSTARNGCATRAARLGMQALQNQRKIR
jgi:hypothetical protein